MGTDLVIGVDFDNTIVSYDDLMSEVSRERGLLPEGSAAGKKEIRQRVRGLPDGELQWRRLQAVVYGSRMREANLADGADTFFRKCLQHGAKLYVVSHKTRYSEHDPSRTDMRAVALQWMTDHRFFEREGLGLSRTDVFFEGTRRGKIERLKALGCPHFIDDLEETLLDTSFPIAVQKILYAPGGIDTEIPGTRVAATWREIGECIFDSAG